MLEIVAKPTDTAIYIPFKGTTIEVLKSPDGLWRDKTGCVWAFEEESAMTDKESRIGVWPFVFPRGTVLDGPAKVHDYLYSCPAYQAFHTREEADAYLREAWLAVTENGWSQLLRVFVYPFSFLASTFGGRYWDNPKTRVFYPGGEDATHCEGKKDHAGDGEAVRREESKERFLRDDQ